MHSLEQRGNCGGKVRELSAVGNWVSAERIRAWRVSQHVKVKVGEREPVLVSVDTEEGL